MQKINVFSYKLRTFFPAANYSKCYRRIPSYHLNFNSLLIYFSFWGCKNIRSEWLFNNFYGKITSSQNGEKTSVNEKVFFSLFNTAKERKKASRLIFREKTLKL